MDSKIQFIWKKYSELSTNDLYAILNLRQQVFVVEQNCVYQDIDDKSIRFLKASQYEYDKWSAREFPDSDNAKVFNLINGLIR